MNVGSLRLRLLLATIASTVVALSLAGLALAWIFDQFATGRLNRELDSHLRQLAGVMELKDDGKVRVEQELADPKFADPLGGLYWQINDKSGVVVRSRSLWDRELDVADKLPEKAGPFHFELSEKSRASTLVLRGRTVLFDRSNNDGLIHLMIAIDKRELSAARRSFLNQLVASLTMLALILSLAAWIQISVGLRPLAHIGRQINLIHSGVSRRLEGEFPSEILLLADKLNSLLEAQERTIARTRARAGNLAHGLKTPLAILSAEGRTLRNKGDNEVAAELEKQIALMRRSVERELARSRDRTALNTTGTKVELAIKEIVAAMKRLPNGSVLGWHTDIPADAVFPMQQDDFNDVFGNLLDNARKWARSTVTLEYRQTADQCQIIVEDDGPGVSLENLPSIKERGQRLDAEKPGSGLGLAIVHDLVDVYNGALGFESRQGESNCNPGFRVVVTLPVGGEMQLKADEIAFNRRD